MLESSPMKLEMCLSDHCYWGYHAGGMGMLQGTSLKGNEDGQQQLTGG